MQATAAEDKPVIALAMGDPAGISPELTAKIVADDAVRAKARLLVIGDRRVFDEGARPPACAAARYRI
jgi:4-hydroxythreonine-4-phosphate dehydrogenase